MTADERLHLFGSHFGTYEVEAGPDDRPRLLPFRHDPAPSPTGAAFLDLADHPLRVRHPMVRRGWLTAKGRPQGRGAERGWDEFVAVTWPEAARLVAGELARVSREYGNAAIFGGSYGWASAGRFHHAQSQLKRFLNLCGGFTSSVNTYSYGAAAVLLPHVIGRDYQGATDTAPSWDQIAAHARLLISFGGFRLSNAQVEAGGTGQHRAEAALADVARAGCRIVVFSPTGADAPDLPGHVEHIPLRPGTDAAVLIAMAQVLLAEGRTDTAALARLTAGHETFAAYLAGHTDGLPKTPEWAEGISGVPADTIRALARAYGQTPALVNLSWSLQRSRHGEQPYWAAIALAAMAGQVGEPGCGFAFGLTAVSSVGQPIRRLKGPAVPQGRNPVSSFIPVARITELLENPGGTLDYDGQRLALPDIRLIYWAGGNPFHHHQDLNRLAAAFRRPETVIVHESMWTATARHADIVLPASLPFERDDIAAASRDNWLIASRLVLAPPPDVRSDHDMLALIARELGLDAAFTEGRSEEDWLRHLYAGYRDAHPELPDFDTFWARGYAGLDLGARAPAPTTPLADFARDPDLHPLSTPSGRIEIGSSTIAAFGYDDCPGHPAWLEPEEWLGAPLAGTYPLHLLSPQPEHRLHSQLELAGPSQRAKVTGCEVLLLSPQDAAARGLAAGEQATVFNARGRALVAIGIDARLSPGVAILPTGGWYAPNEQGLDLGGNPNTVSSIRPTSRLAQGTAPNACLVEVVSR